MDLTTLHNEYIFIRNTILKLQQDSVAAFVTVVTVVIVGMLLKKVGSKIIRRYREIKTAKNLKPFIEYSSVKKARDSFIQTRFQSECPSVQHEPDFGGLFADAKLIPTMIKEYFDENRERHKFNLVLGDSGMGKSTFMINLYMKYTSIFNFNKKYKIKLVPFGDRKNIEHLKDISMDEARKTILLLDAFDEDKGLRFLDDGLSYEKRFKKRLDEVLEIVENFFVVIITCRTQYFLGEADTADTLKIAKYCDKNEFHELNKIYIPPFNQKEIKYYLNKKYGIIRFWNMKKKKIAKNIIERYPKLMCRPMLLTYVDFLVNTNKEFETIFDIYGEMVKGWVDRETKKLKSSNVERNKFKDNLCSYSQLVAVEIYKNKFETGNLYLTKDLAISIAKKNSINLDDYELTEQSLLMCDAENNFKFAHKSIYEFFIAKEIIENPSFLKELHLDDMDMTETFLRENGEFVPVRIKGDVYLMGSPQNEHDRKVDEKQHRAKVSDFVMGKYLVTVAQFERFVQEGNYRSDNSDTWMMGSNGKIQKDKQHPVVNVSWNDVKEYCKWLSNRHNLEFRLPTEAEWEYACRAGTTTPFNTGQNLTISQANYNGNFPYKNSSKGLFKKHTTPVGIYPPNAWGLYDVHGNTWEWCGDWYSSKYYDECNNVGLVKNPTGPVKGSNRVLRGGGWSDDGKRCRSAYRCSGIPDNRCGDIGFRLVFAM